jgi:hypothetical protein
MRLSQLEKLIQKHAKQDQRCCRRISLLFERRDITLELLKTTLTEITDSASSPFTLDPLIDKHYAPFVKRLSTLISPGAMTRIDVMDFITQWENDWVRSQQVQNHLSQPISRP